LPSNGIEHDRLISRSKSSGVDVADLLGQVGSHIVRHVFVHGVFGGPGRIQTDHRRQDLVVDGDAGDGVLGQVTVLRDDHGHGRADVMHHPVGQHVRGPPGVQRGMRDEDGQRLGGCAGQILVAVDGDDAVHVQRTGDVDVADPGVRVRGPDESRLQSPGVHADVVGIAAVAGHQPAVLHPPHRGAHVPADHQDRSRRSSAARRTASTMA
jgi:hypothetical protein